jgi:DNA polymerase-3 subunit gamma/tau
MSSCKAIDSGSSLDVSEIDAASHNGVDDARELIEHATLLQHERSRNFYLDEAHLLPCSQMLAKCMKNLHLMCIFCVPLELKSAANCCVHVKLQLRACLWMLLWDNWRRCKAESSRCRSSNTGIARTCGGLRDACNASQLSLLTLKLHRLSYRQCLAVSVKRI